MAFLTILAATGGSRWQRISLVSAAFVAGRLPLIAAGCNRWAPSSPTLSLRLLTSGALPLGGGEGERDPRAAARAVFGPDPPALGLDKSASDRKSEA